MYVYVYVHTTSTKDDTKLLKKHLTHFNMLHGWISNKVFVYKGVEI